MLECALDAKVPCGWVTGDAVYGGDRQLRLWLELREQAFVLAVACNEPLWYGGLKTWRADQIVQEQPAQVWQRLSAGAGAKGERLYDWALIPLWRLQLSAEERRFGHYLLARRSLSDPSELAYYVVFAPRQRAALETLVKVAGRRWEIEVGFETTKAECGLDQYEIRRWQGWYRHITLSLLAHAVLVVLRKREKKNTIGPNRLERGRTASDAHAPCLASYGIEQALHWSNWRRRHQFLTRQCHYRSRGFTPPS